MNVLAFWQLARMHKPIGILLLLWPTLWSLWIAAQGVPPLHLLLVFVFGTIIMRAAGCVINDIADRKFDKHVVRTLQRPITAGIISVKAAIIFFILLLVIAFALVLTLNMLTIYLSFVGLMLTITYPLTKRFFKAPQLYLGFTFGWGVPMAFAAVENHVPYIAWILYVANIIWIIAYDTMYAMVDKEDDIKINIYSTALLFGQHDRLIIGMLQILFLVVLVYIAHFLNLNPAFYWELVLAAAFFLYQQYLIKDRVPSECFKAFLNNNWVGLVIFLGLIFVYL